MLVKNWSKDCGYYSPDGGRTGYYVSDASLAILGPGKEYSMVLVATGCIGCSLRRIYGVIAEHNHGDNYARAS